MATVKPITVLKQFFGLKLGQTMADFLREVRELSQEEKIELATLAAAQMGVELDITPA